MSFDSRIDTYQHIQAVQRFMGRAIANLMDRQQEHDQSKLVSPEKEAYDVITPRLAGSTYGSDEYKATIREMKPSIDHHYAANSHHPEHYRWQCPICELQIDDTAWTDAPQGPNDSGVRYCPRCSRHGLIYESELLISPNRGIRGMSLMDIVEMLVDWKAATLRHHDGDLLKSVEINQKRFGYSDELKSILLQTIAELGLSK